MHMFCTYMDRQLNAVLRTLPACLFRESFAIRARIYRVATPTDSQPFGEGLFSKSYFVAYPAAVPKTRVVLYQRSKQPPHYEVYSKGERIEICPVRRAGSRVIVRE